MTVPGVVAHLFVNPVMAQRFVRALNYSQVQVPSSLY